ncbi:pseudouridine-5'-phosphate glycosidase [Gracilinema caldarium]|uniref:pseudouridine-5'-phosphate glycosidase n=1 Tax=Gracilinema caldarium TaxID=215591 RepID=UPI0026F1F5FD|nr:pseudouridine-5'-phosphate glycosidase [Gracilinema caldarium]
MKKTETQEYLELSPEVDSALRDGRPVVALESTIISHGMPYPKNVETALQVEAQVRSKGAIPATIAIMNGKLKAGLTTDEIEFLGKKGLAVIKSSRRDIPFVLAKKETGATTVAATMIVAHMAGVRIFATGGIGGVHRFAQETFDISADLEELARTSVAVICAGAKSILDLGLTLEYLETRGVPVIGYKTKELPAFYCRESGFPVDYRLDTPEEIAQVLSLKWQTGLEGGVVIANPIPEAYALPKADIDRIIEQALSEARSRGIKGKETTPFLLAKIVELSGGKSLEANIQLVLNNASLAAQIAAKLAER